MSSLEKSLNKNEIIEFVILEAIHARLTPVHDLVLAEFGLPMPDMMDIIFVLEDRLDISIPYYSNARSRAWTSVRTVGNLANLVARLVAEADRPSSGASRTPPYPSPGNFYRLMG